MTGSRPSDAEHGTGAGQVVQLRREWFGPVAELIPFGAAAEARAQQSPTAPVSAADFWGGDADLLQEVVERADGGWDTAGALEAAADCEPLVPEVASDEPTVTRARGRVVGHPIAIGLAVVAVVIVVSLVAAGAMSSGVSHRPAVTASLPASASDRHARVHRVAPVIRRHRAVAKRSVVHTPTSTYVASSSSSTARSVVNYSAPPPP